MFENERLIAVVNGYRIKHYLRRAYKAKFVVSDETELKSEALKTLIPRDTWLMPLSSASVALCVASELTVFAKGGGDDLAKGCVSGKIGRRGMSLHAS